RGSAPPRGRGRGEGPGGDQSGPGDAEHRDRARPRSLPAGEDTGKRVSVWADVFLGIIAVATLAMAIVQIGVIVAAGRLARRVDRLADQVERELKPLFVHANAIGRDAARAVTAATAPVGGAGKVLACPHADSDQA